MVEKKVRFYGPSLLVVALGVLVAGAVFLMLQGCATTSVVQNTYKTLAVSKDLYVATMGSLGELYKNGKITEEEKYNITFVANMYRQTHFLMVDALATLSVLKDEVQKGKVEKDIEEFAKELASYLQALRDILFRLQK